MPRSYCPECDAVISVDNPRDGDQFRCPECNEKLEVVNSDPFEVYYAYEYEEEWDT